nr:hypothetical protein Itr_chr12CG31210 [Ipomoea trifida]
MQGCIDSNCTVKRNFDDSSKIFNLGKKIGSKWWEIVKPKYRKNVTFGFSCYRSSAESANLNVQIVMRSVQRHQAGPKVAPGKHHIPVKASKLVAAQIVDSKKIRSMI